MLYVQIRCLQRARPRFIAGPVALVNRRPPAFQYQYTYVTDTYEYLGECEYAPLNVKGAAGLTTQGRKGNFIDKCQGGLTTQGRKGDGTSDSIKASGETDSVSSINNIGSTSS